MDMYNIGFSDVENNNHKQITTNKINKAEVVKINQNTKEKYTLELRYRAL